MRGKVAAWIDGWHNKRPGLAGKVSMLVAVSLVVGQSLLVAVPIFFWGGVKLLAQQFKQPALRKHADKHIIATAQRWIGINNWLIDHWLPSKSWQIELPAGLAADKNYLLICNHQSWVDTTIIQYISQNRLPLTRFFTKFELLYLPVVGQAFYLLDFPMMKRRHKKATPAQADRDLNEARRACQLLKDKPFVLLNYLEGTRFSKSKHHAQQSPYRWLLKPKAGGLALAIASLGDEIDGILDMTLVYPDGVPSYSDFWAGKTRRLVVDIRPVALPKALFLAIKRGAYGTDQSIRQDFYDWLAALWQEKDRRIDTYSKPINGLLTAARKP